MAVEDEGIRGAALNKNFQLEVARSAKAEKEAEEFRSNLKPRVKADGEFIGKMASGRYRGRGGAREMIVEEGTWLASSYRCNGIGQ